MPKPTSKKNLIYLPDGVAEDADFGDEIEVNAMGKLVDHKGTRCLQVKEVDGEPVREAKKEKSYRLRDDDDDDEDMDEDEDVMYVSDGNSLDEALDATFNRSR